MSGAAAAGGGGGEAPAVNIERGKIVRLRHLRGEKVPEQLKEEAAEIIGIVASIIPPAEGATFHADIITRGGKHAVELQISGHPAIISAAQEIAQQRGWRPVGRVAVSEHVLVKPYAQQESSNTIRRRIEKQFKASEPQPPTKYFGMSAFQAAQQNAAYREARRRHTTQKQAAMSAALAAAREEEPALISAARDPLQSMPGNFRRQNMMRLHAAYTNRNITRKGDRPPREGVLPVAKTEENYPIIANRARRIATIRQRSSRGILTRTGYEQTVAERIAAEITSALSEE